MKDTKLLDCVSSPRGFCLQADLQAFCSYLNRVAIWAEYWSVSSEGIWGQYQINLSRDCTDTLVYICLSYLKEKRMHPQPNLPPSSNRNNLSEKGKKFLLRAADSLLPDLSSCTTVILKAKEQHPVSGYKTMTHLDHHHLLTSIISWHFEGCCPSEKPVIKGMNAAGLVLYLHQLKIVTGQKHPPVWDTEWQHGLQGQLGQIKIYQQKENKHW